MSPWTAYLLGLATLPGLALYFFLLYLVLDPGSKTYWCQWCEDYRSEPGDWVPQWVRSRGASWHIKRRHPAERSKWIEEYRR